MSTVQCQTYSSVDDFVDTFVVPTFVDPVTHAPPEFRTSILRNGHKPNP